MDIARAILVALIALSVALLPVAGGCPGVLPSLNKESLN
jgi:hypothetical protein